VDLLEHRPPTDATVKELYANALICAVPGCDKPLFNVRGPGRRSLNSRVAHICARSENGPRWDVSQSEEDNRSADNLIVVCIEHAAEIDLPHRLAEFRAETLRDWKRTQLEAYDEAIRQRSSGVAQWDLSSEELEQIGQSWTDNSIRFRAETMIFGGLGGAALGASGGGGAAIGPGALGGAGGPVGKIVVGRQVR
jgi:hypothetical protein